MPINKNGLVLWEGPSELDGSPIVVVATGLKRTHNVKVGKSTIQIWYLPRNIAPIVAIKTGEDTSVCGDCKRRPVNGGDCYVVTFRGPHTVWKAYRRGSYQRWDGVNMLPFIGRIVRFGAWGDPASVPAGTLQSIRDVTQGWMAYTHQWARPSAAHMRPWCMASVDDVPEAERAHAAGWRTFRARSADAPLLTGERVCPAATEAPTHGRVFCESCRLCDGTTRGARRPSIAIQTHGFRAKR